MVINYCFVICATQQDVQDKKTNKELMLLKEMIAGNCENDKKQVTISKTQNFLMYQQVVHIVTTAQ